MVGSTDDNDVHIFVVDQLPPVFVEVFYLLSGQFLRLGSPVV